MSSDATIGELPPPPQEQQAGEQQRLEGAYQHQSAEQHAGAQHQAGGQQAGPPAREQPHPVHVCHPQDWSARVELAENLNPEKATDVLPPLLAAIADSASRLRGVHPGMAALSIVPVMATPIAASLRVAPELNTCWSVQPNAWSIVNAASGAGSHQATLRQPLLSFLSFHEFIA